MIRWALALALLAGLLAAAAGIELRTDAAAAFGAAGPERGLLEGPEGRQATLAVIGEDPAARSRAARELAALAEASPLVARARTGPEAGSATFDWLWERRFRLAPPAPEDLTAAAMAARLAEARAALTRAEGLALGDRLLRDPTGAFARLLERLTAARPELPAAGGVWQSRDGRAALVFLALADRPFAAGETAALAATLREAAAARGLRAIVVGPRIVAAETSRAVERASATAAGVAGGLLLVWLVATLRSARALLAALAPLAFGLLGGTLAVAAAFGSVHVIALGFGGALTGLALDYPLHLATHRGAGTAHARRLVLLGAATTATAFLALLGSGVEALAQTGVFVAAGLLAAAAAAVALVRPGDAAPRGPMLPAARLPRARWARRGAEAALAAAGIAALTLPEGAGPGRLFELPERSAAEIAELRGMLEAPSVRHVLEARGPDAESALARAQAALGVLEAARAAGEIAGYASLAEHLPTRAAQAAAAARLPGAETVKAAARAALGAAGMATGFAGEIAEAYAAARAAPPVRVADFAAEPALAPLGAGVAAGPEGARIPIRLEGLSAPEAFGARIAAAGIEGLALRDRGAEVEAALARIREAALLWLGIGAGAAAAVLVLGAGRARGRVPGLLLATAGAAGLAAAAVWAIGGPLGIFEIVALTLVVGIGIDYGLFLRLAPGPGEAAAARASVALCAGTTLIAFAVMALSPVALLSEIGLTVSLGVAAMLGLHWTAPRGREENGRAR